MTNYEYKSVDLPVFVNVGKDFSFTSEVAKLINFQAVDGWEYYDSVIAYEHKPAGCLAIFTRQQGETISHTILIFRKEK
jgi:hypothetical protein